MSAPIWTKRSFFGLWPVYRCGHRELRWRKGRWEMRFEYTFYFGPWFWLCYDPYGPGLLSCELDAKEKAMKVRRYSGREFGL